MKRKTEAAKQKVKHVAVTTQNKAKVLLDEPDEIVLKRLEGFVYFLREKAVVGLAVGFIIGQQAQGLIKQLVDSFITPFLNVLVGSNLAERKFTIVPGDNSTLVTWGKFVYVAINFIFVILAIYIIIKIFKLDKLDLPKSSKKK